MPLSSDENMQSRSQLLMQKMHCSRQRLIGGRFFTKVRIDSGPAAQLKVGCVQPVSKNGREPPDLTSC
jgi:hypothetical protein